ncbi:MAG: tetratricopeptide repeat protein [Deltaproteobacteria bacterium]|nr:tetratricopeptide repeat protein [Deltaproteobacteria bacterium]
MKDHKNEVTRMMLQTEDVMFFKGESIKVHVDVDSNALAYSSFLDVMDKSMAECGQFTVAVMKLVIFGRDSAPQGDFVDRTPFFRQAINLINEEIDYPFISGKLDMDSLIFFFPDITPVLIEDRLPKVLSRMVRELDCRAYVGLAGHPFGPFTKQDTLDCARKALVHATYFVPGKVQRFDATSLNISGDRKFNSGDLDAAIQELKYALEVDDNDVNIINSLGVCYGYKGWYEQAMLMFEKAIELEPVDYMYEYNLGFACWKQDLKKKARDHFAMALKKKGDDFDLLFLMARIYKKDGELAKCIHYLEAAVRMPNCRPRAHRMLAEIYWSQGDLKGAINQFKNAVKLNPNDPASLSSLAEIYLNHGRNLEIALSFCQHSVKLDRNNPIFRKRLGMALLLNGFEDEARREFEEAIRLGAPLGEITPHLDRIVAPDLRIQEFDMDNDRAAELETILD